VLIFCRRAFDSSHSWATRAAGVEGRKAIGYFVTWGEVDDRGFVPRLTLEAARALACQLLRGGAADVAIGSTSGPWISGEPLAACCRNEALLTFNLQPIERAK
jgi:hypothetical protein